MDDTKKARREERQRRREKREEKREGRRGRVLQRRAWERQREESKAGRFEAVIGEALADPRIRDVGLKEGLLMLLGIVVAMWRANGGDLASAALALAKLWATQADEEAASLEGAELDPRMVRPAGEAIAELPEELQEMLAGASRSAGEGPGNDSAEGEGAEGDSPNYTESQRKSRLH